MKDPGLIALPWTLPVEVDVDTWVIGWTGEMRSGLKPHQVEDECFKVQPELTDVGATLADGHSAGRALGDTTRSEIGVVFCQIGVT